MYAGRVAPTNPTDLLAELNIEAQTVARGERGSRAAWVGAVCVRVVDIDHPDFRGRLSVDRDRLDRRQRLHLVLEEQT